MYASHTYVIPYRPPFFFAASYVDREPFGSPKEHNTTYS